MNVKIAHGLMDQYYKAINSGQFGFHDLETFIYYDFTSLEKPIGKIFTGVQGCSDQLARWKKAFSNLAIKVEYETFGNNKMPNETTLVVAIVLTGKFDGKWSDSKTTYLGNGSEIALECTHFVLVQGEQIAATIMDYKLDSLYEKIGYAQPESVKV